MRIIVLPGAREQLKYCARWWRRKRPESRRQVRSEFKRVADNLLNDPYLGVTYPERDGVHVIGMMGMPYRIFYEVHEAAQEIHILAFWSGQRGEGPPL